MILWDHYGQRVLYRARKKLHINFEFEAVQKHVNLVDIERRAANYAFSHYRSCGYSRARALQS